MDVCEKGTPKGALKTPRGWASVRKEPEMYPESSLRMGAFEKGKQKGARKLSSCKQRKEKGRPENTQRMGVYNKRT